MQKSMLQLREKAVQHGYIYWWEFKNPLNTLSWRNQCNTLIFNKGPKELITRLSITFLLPKIKIMKKLN